VGGTEVRAAFNTAREREDRIVDDLVALLHLWGRGTALDLLGAVNSVALADNLLVVSAGSAICAFDLTVSLTRPGAAS
jgi:hypothetical protein